MTPYTVPGMSTADAERVTALLQERLSALSDLALTLKHVHWNVTGPNFIAVHTMLDPQVAAVRAMTDETAERIATLGGSPDGTPGALAARRESGDYSLGRATALRHLGALDLVYGGLVAAHRAAIHGTDMLDLVTREMLIGQSRKLERFHWFVRAHLEAPDGSLAARSARAERAGAYGATL